MVTAPTSKYMCSPGKATTTVADHAQAASVPIEISVSIVAAPCRRLSAAARWKGQPLQHDRRRQRQRKPLPTRELKQRH